MRGSGRGSGIFRYTESEAWHLRSRRYACPVGIRSPGSVYRAWGGSSECTPVRSVSMVAHGGKYCIWRSVSIKVGQPTHCSQAGFWMPLSAGRVRV